MPVKRRVAHTKKAVDDYEEPEPPGRRKIGAARVPARCKTPRNSRNRDDISPSGTETYVSYPYSRKAAQKRQNPQVMTEGAGKFDTVPRGKQQQLQQAAARGNTRVTPEPSVNYPRPSRSALRDSTNSRVITLEPSDNYPRPRQSQFKTPEPSDNYPRPFQCRVKTPEPLDNYPRPSRRALRDSTNSRVKTPEPSDNYPRPRLSQFKTPEPSDNYPRRVQNDPSNSDSSRRSRSRRTGSERSFNNKEQEVCKKYENCREEPKTPEFTGWVNDPNIKVKQEEPPRSTKLWTDPNEVIEKAIKAKELEKQGKSSKTLEKQAAEELPKAKSTQRSTKKVAEPKTKTKTSSSDLKTNSSSSSTYSLGAEDKPKSSQSMEKVEEPEPKTKGKTNSSRDTKKNICPESKYSKNLTASGVNKRGQSSTSTTNSNSKAKAKPNTTALSKNLENQSGKTTQSFRRVENYPKIPTEMIKKEKLSPDRNVTNFPKIPTEMIKKEKLSPVRKVTNFPKIPTEMIKKEKLSPDRNVTNFPKIPTEMIKKEKLSPVRKVTNFPKIPTEMIKKEKLSPDRNVTNLLKIPQIKEEKLSPVKNKKTLNDYKKMKLEKQSIDDKDLNYHPAELNNSGFIDFIKSEPLSSSDYADLDADMEEMCREEMMNETISVKQEPTTPDKTLNDKKPDLYLSKNRNTDSQLINNEMKDDVPDEIDRRLNAEIESMFATFQEGGNPPLIKEEPPDKEPSLPPADPEKIDADMDARLQAELDSLPMVQREIELPSSSAPSFSINYPKVITTLVPPVPPVVAPTKLHSSVFTIAPPPVRTLAQIPIVTRLKNVRGEDIAVQYTTGPDGLITNVQMVPPSSKGSFTASQLHQILQSSQPYLPLPIALKPEDIKKEPLGNTRDIPVEQQVVEDEEVDYEEIGVADTFAAYWPSKLKVGRAHPDSVVETATLSSVELPDITYELQLPAETTDCLSALQLEAVVYACQAHEQILPSGERAGFLLGDGAGVGKGRTIAGIIYDNYVKGRQRALWISVSSDLKFDAERDLADIGAHDKVRVVAISKFKYSRISSDENDKFKKGVIFCTYTALIGESVTANSKYKTRLRQLIQWLGKNFDGVIVFDECHKAKNLSLMNVGKSTKTGTTVLELQKLLPKARVVYASATGASEPRNMAYMVRLGLWGRGTAYPEFYEFVNAVEKRGIGAMEIVAMDMKLRGTYIARQLSFKDVSFRIEEVPMPKDFRKCYNLSAELWADINKRFQKACRLMCIENRVQKIITCQFWCAHQRFFKNLCIASKVNHVVKMTRRATRMGKAVVIGLQSTGESRTLEHLERHHGKLSTFVSTSKMIIQSFVEKHFPAPKRDSFHHLLNTGEFEPEARSRPPRPKKAKMNPDWFDDDEDAEAGDSDIEMYESTLNSDDEKGKAGRKRRGRPPKVDKVEKITMQERILQHLCNNMRAQDNDGEPTYTFDNTKPQKANITERDVERCITSREQLLEKIEALGKRMPPNTLDKLISELGGTNLVAEMTGRRGRVVRTEYDGFKYEPRCENDTSMDLVNYREKQRFMNGSKHVAIISEAASSGISLQSDKRVSNQRRRLHITLELPWSADRAIQQFGRTHRSNQVNSPEYVFVITDLAGERRFASTVAKRLESLGALTQGDRRATDARDLSQFNIDNSIGRSALEEVMQQLTSEKPIDPSQIPESYKGDFLYDCSISMAGVGMLNVREENKVKVFSVEKDSNNISKFLNRILGCRVEIQNALFKFFLDKMYSLIMQMKRSGRFDLGILDLDAHGASVKSIKLMRFIRRHATGTAATELHTVIVERGMAFETALAKFRKEGHHDHDGFYVLQQLRHNKNSSILCLQSPTNAADGATGKINLQIYRPNTGPQVRLETLSSISERYVKVTPEEAREFWLLQYDSCLNMCSHVYWNRICPFSVGCEVGLRVRKYHVLSGLMLPIWDRIELIIEKNGHKIQIIRVKTDVNKKIVGTVVPHAVYDALVADLSSDSKVESQ